MRVEELADLDDPRVTEYRSLRRVARLRSAGRFVAEGARVVRQLLASPLRVRSLLLEARWLDALRAELEARAEPDLVVFLATKPELERIVGYHVHQGVMAVADAPEPPPLVPHLAERPGHLLVAVTGVANAENVGGILRNMHGLGATGLLLDPSSHDPFVRRAARVSMGAVFHLPVWRTRDLPATLRELRARCGTRSLAAHVHPPVVPIAEADLSGPLCLVLGSEADGVPAPVLAACDASVRIPMASPRACLNVANAAAVFLYEIARRRSAAAAEEEG